MNYATTRYLRRTSWLTALKAAAVAGVLGIAVLVAASELSSHSHKPEQAATAQVDAITSCYRSHCGYQVFYVTAQGTPELVTIPAPAGEARLFASTTVYYQDASPGNARFPDTDYASDPSDAIYSLGVILVLFALVMLLVSAGKLAFARAGRKRVPLTR